MFGTPEEDALRRDFTVNALYYNIADFSVIDYAGGVADLANGILRLIGDPETRYREDPVRMLRAVRFAAKLGFRIAADTEQPIGELAPLLGDIPWLGRLFRNETVQNKDTDLVLTLTPQIIRFPDIEEEDLAPVWVGTESRISFSGTRPRVQSGRAPRGPFDERSGAKNDQGGSDEGEPSYGTPASRRPTVSCAPAAGSPCSSPAGGSCRSLRSIPCPARVRPRP